MQNWNLEVAAEKRICCKSVLRRNSSVIGSLPIALTDLPTLYADDSSWCERQFSRRKANHGRRKGWIILELSTLTRGRSVPYQSLLSLLLSSSLFSSPWLWLTVVRTSANVDALPSCIRLQRSFYPLASVCLSDQRWASGDSAPIQLASPRWLITHKASWLV